HERHDVGHLRIRPAEHQHRQHGQRGADAARGQRRKDRGGVLGLLRGRDNSKLPLVTTHTIYNRFIWNFTSDINGGEVAYSLNYNVRNESGDVSGTIDEADAKVLYPQGHGDAWGHYLTAVKKGDFTVPLGRSDVKRKGKDVTIVTYSKMLQISMEAANQLAAEGIEAEVIDLRSLRPLDLDPVFESFKKTNRAVIVEEGW
ncbi:MAG: transketolase C-terminal domain-containing protein, partial [Chloroflexota bacterium]